MGKRKMSRGNISADVFKKAARDVTANGNSIRQAARIHGIDRTTLSRYMNKATEMGKTDVPMGYSSHRKVFTESMEIHLAKHLTDLCDRFFGLHSDKVKSLAFEFAVKNKLNIPASWQKNQRAGRHWLKIFMDRHKLSFRTPEATSCGRATAFNKSNVSRYFDNLYHLMEKHEFGPGQIYDMDETGCTTVQTPRSVIAKLGVKQVGALTSGERGRLVTMVGTINALGNDVPPMFVFPLKRFKSHMLNNAPTGSIGAAQPTGWMTEDLFLDYLDHFKNHTRCSPEKPVLLVLDNHTSHISLEASEKGRDYGIKMLTLHPHTSDKLQPLDKAVYGPFKAYYDRSLDNWMRTHPGRTCTIYDIPGIVKEAYNLAFTRKNIEAAFRSTGIFPLNRDIYTDADFLPSDVTDRPDPTITTGTENISADTSTESIAIATEEAIVCAAQVPTENGTSGTKENDNSAPVAETPKQKSVHKDSYTPPSKIIPLPKAAARKNTTKRKKGKSIIITSTPEKNRLQKEKQERMKNCKKPNKQQPAKKIRMKCSSKQAKKTVKRRGSGSATKKVVDSTSTSEDETKMVLDDHSENELSGDDDQQNICCICSDQYRHLEEWVKCVCSSCKYCNPSQLAASTAGP